MWIADFEWQFCNFKIFHAIIELNPDLNITENIFSG